MAQGPNAQCKRDKHSRLLGLFVSYEEKKVNTAQGPNSQCFIFFVTEE
jgi:hypothetical protein